MIRVAHPAAGQEVGPVPRAAAVWHLREALPPRLVRAGAEDVRLGWRPGCELQRVQASRVDCPHGHAGGQLLPQVLLVVEKISCGLLSQPCPCVGDVVPIACHGCCSRVCQGTSTARGLLLNIQILL